MDPSAENENAPPPKTGPKKIPHLNWTSKDIADFRAIWDRMVGKEQADLDGMGVTLLVWMFTHMPLMRHRFDHFSKLNDDELIGEEKFLTHAKGIVTKLNELIGVLHDPPMFVDTVQTLALTHLFFNPPVTVKYFQDFRDKIHLFVAKVLGCSPESKECQMWYEFLNSFVMIFNDEGEMWSQTVNTGAPQHEKVAESAMFRRSYFRDRFHEEESKWNCCSIM